MNLSTETMDNITTMVALIGNLLIYVVIALILSQFIQKKFQGGEEDD